MTLILLGVCVFALGLSVAGAIWAAPRAWKWRTVRRFRTRLALLDAVVLIWEQSVDTA